MVKVENLNKSFFDIRKGENLAVNNVSFKINKGEVFGLLGPNGAGKTTLLRMLSTVLMPTSGEAQIAGYNIRGETNEIKKSIGFLSGNTKLYGRLTPKELMSYFGKLYEMNKKEIKVRLDEVVEMFEMGSFVNIQIDKLSTGQVQRTSIARCIIHNPQIYIFDEPTIGLDILSSKTILDFIKKESEKGKTIIFSTHYMEEAEYLCTRIGLIFDGRILDIKTLDEYRKETGKNNLYDIFYYYIRQFQNN